MTRSEERDRGNRMAMLRQALTEIPVGMSHLRVSTDEPNGMSLINRNVIDSPLDNIPIGYLTPSPSQDERNYFCLLFFYVNMHFFRFIQKLIRFYSYHSAAWAPSHFNQLVTRENSVQCIGSAHSNNDNDATKFTEKTFTHAR